MVAAAVLSESKTGDEAARLIGGRWEFAAPSHWKAEFANVIWKAVQLGRIVAADIDEIISRADALPIEPVDIGELWRGAVMRAVAADHPVYDTLFVELAIRLRTSVASYDRRFQRRFPSLVKPPAELLASLR